MSTALEEAKSQFAETLFKDYKNFIPTQAVYLDIEGEMAINFFYPMLKGEDRFKFLFPEYPKLSVPNISYRVGFLSPFM